MKKGVLIGAGTLIAAIIIAVVIVLSGLDAIIKSAIESYGPQMTQSDVEVDDVELSPSGEGSVRGMSVDNPEGFESEQAFSLTSIDVAIDTDTLTSDVVVIKKIAIHDPHITYEIQKGGRNNLDTIIENVNAYIDALTGGANGDAGADDAGEGDAAAQGESQKFIVEDLLLEGGKVSVIAQGLGLGEVSADLPRIHMTDIGKKEGGADAGQIVDVILTKVKGGALGAMQGLDISQLNNMLANSDELFKKGLDSLNVQGEKGTLTKDAEEAFEGIKGMFSK